jgi:hypothetical protein
VLPVANGAASASGFMEHALVVLAVPPVAIAVATAGRAIAHRVMGGERTSSAATADIAAS